MTKIQKHIEIVRTNSGMRSIGRESSEAMKAVLDLYYSDVSICIVNTLPELQHLVARRPDLVINGIKFLPGTDIGVAGYLEEHFINHTGSTQSAIMLETHKPLAKQRAVENGIKTARLIVVKKADMCPDIVAPLSFPLFIKPASSGGGKGIDEESIADNNYEFQRKIASLKAENLGDILVEEFLPGREFSVAILKDIVSGELIAMPIELIAPVDIHGTPVLSQEVKESNEEIILTVSDPLTRALVTTIAKKAFKAIGARDFGRIDVRMDAEGVPHFLEANLIPSLKEGYGSFPKSCLLNEGIDYENMILKIVRLAFEHPSTIRQLGDELIKLMEPTLKVKSI